MIPILKRPLTVLGGVLAGAFGVPFLRHAWLKWANNQEDPVLWFALVAGTGVVAIGATIVVLSQCQSWTTMDKLARTWYASRHGFTLRVVTNVLLSAALLGSLHPALAGDFPGGFRLPLLLLVLTQWSWLAVEASLVAPSKLQRLLDASLCTVFWAVAVWLWWAYLTVEVV